MKLLTITFLLIVLFGCAPTGGTYYKFKYQNSEYLKEACHGKVGAPSTIYFEYHGIFLSSEIDGYKNRILLGVHVPDGKVVRLINKQLEVEYKADNGTQSLVLELVPIRHQEFGSAAPYVFKTNDPYGSADYFGDLTGETRHITFKWGSAEYFAHRWYQYSVPLGIEKISSGSISFPPMLIDTVEYKGPVLPFKKSLYAGFTPLNC